MKTIKLFLLSAAVMLSAVSCEDMFELERPETVPFASVKDMWTVVPAPYTLLFNKGWATPYGINTVINETASDLVMMNPYSADNEFFYYNDRTINDEEMSKADQLWEFCYAAITTSSDPLNMIEDAEDAGKSLFQGMTSEEQSQLDQIAGELYFVRGMANWYLSRAYMPPYTTVNKDQKYIPLKTTVSYDPDEIRNPYIGTMQEVYEAMLSDFTKAKAKLAPFGKGRYGYGNTYAASQMLMRLNFIMGQDEAIGTAGGYKAAAIAEADYIINSNIFTLKNQDPIRAFNRNVNEIYCDQSHNDQAKEVVFDLIIKQINGGVYVSNVCRLSLSGMPTKIYAANKKVSMTMNDPLWSNGMRNYSAKGWDWHKSLHSADAAMNQDLVYHEKNSVVYWNPNTIKQIGWAATNDPTDLVNYYPTAEALKDKRFLQLYDFYKGNPEAGTDIFKNSKYPMGVYEKQPQFNNISYNVFWNNKYNRGRHTPSTTIPIFRLPEVYLTRASLQPSTALADVNVVRERAGLDPLTAVTEADVEKERIKEYAFENGDRIIYLNAMKRDITANGRVKLENYSGNPKYNPMTGTPITAYEYPYNKFWMNMPNEEMDFIKQ